MPGKLRIKGHLDGGWSWLVVLGSFLSQFVVMGVNNIFGLLYIDLLEEFKESKATTAWVGSLAFGLLFIMGPLTSFVCTKLGCRVSAILGGLLFGLGLLCSTFVDSIYKMYFTYSLLFSAGCSLCYFSSVLILSEYFSKNLVFANGLGLSGAGVGTIVLAPFVDFLQFYFKWRITVQILSGLSAVLVFSGLLYFLVPPPNSHIVTKDPDEKYVDLSVLKNKAYLVWVIVVGLVLFGFYIPYVHLVRHCQDLGVPKNQAAVLVGYIALSQTLGKIFFGRMADHPRVNRVYLYQLCLLICSVLTTLLPVLTTNTSLMVYCWLFGFSDGCFVVLLAILTGDVVGTSKLAPAYGLMYFITGTPMMFGPPVAGWMYEINQSYNPAFFMAGAFTTAGVCLLFLVPFLLPPEVQEEWAKRSTKYHTRLDLSNSVLSSDSGTKISFVPSEVHSDSQDLQVKETVALKGETDPTREICQESDLRTYLSTFSLNNFLERYLSMPKLTTQQEAMLGNMFNSREHVWIPLCSPARETEV